MCERSAQSRDPEVAVLTSLLDEFGKDGTSHHARADDRVVGRRESTARISAAGSFTLGFRAPARVQPVKQSV
jgi:hypothetical protein